MRGKIFSYAERRVHSEYRIRVERKCGFDHERYTCNKRSHVSDMRGMRPRRGLRIESKKKGGNILHPALV